MLSCPLFPKGTTQSLASSGLHPMIHWSPPFAPHSALCECEKAVPRVCLKWPCDPPLTGMFLLWQTFPDSSSAVKVSFPPTPSLFSAYLTVFLKQVLWSGRDIYILILGYSTGGHFSFLWRGFLLFTHILLWKLQSWKPRSCLYSLKAFILNVSLEMICQFR